MNQNYELSLYDQKLIEKLKLKPIRSIFYHPIKRRKILLVTNSEKKLFVLKFEYPDSPKKFKNRFHKEIQFYLENRNLGFLPNLVNYGNNFLLLEYFESVTLRKWLIKYLQSSKKKKEENIQNNFKILMKIFIEDLGKMFLIKQNTRKDPSNIQKQLLDNWTKFLLSGPMGSKRRKNEDIIAILINISIRIPISILFKKLINKNYIIQDDKFNWLSHGDFHLNNILVESEGTTIKIVDWENINKSSSLVDLSYIYVMIQFLFEDFPLHQKYISTLFRNLLIKYNHHLEFLFFKICKYLKISISTNRRFGYKCSNIMILKNFFSLIPNIILNLILIQCR